MLSNDVHPTHGNERAHNNEKPSHDVDDHERIGFSFVATDRAPGNFPRPLRLTLVPRMCAARHTHIDISSWTADVLSGHEPHHHSPQCCAYSLCSARERGLMLLQTPKQKDTFSLCARTPYSLNVCSLGLIKNIDGHTLAHHLRAVTVRFSANGLGDEGKQVNSAQSASTVFGTNAYVTFGEWWTHAP